MSKQTSVELPNMSPDDTLGNHAVVRCKRGRPSKQTEPRFDESSEFLNTSAEHILGKRAADMNESAEHSLGKRAKVTASSSEQQRGGYKEAREVRMSTDGNAITLDELRKGGVGWFTIRPPVTIACVGRRRFGYHRCMECGKKTNQNPEGNMFASNTRMQIQKQRTA